MFAFIIASGFLIGDDNANDDTIDPLIRNILKHRDAYKVPDSWDEYNNTQCMKCGYVNIGCVCKPVLNTDWEDYKATYDDSGHDDGIADGLEMDSETNYLNNAMRNRDAEIKHKTPSTDDELPF